MDSNVTAANELVITRRIPAPPAAVFAAWTDPAQIPQWFGPHGITIPSLDVDPRPGGLYRVVMRDEAGTDHPVDGVIDEVAAPQRFIFRHMGGPLTGASTTLSFEPDQHGTRFTARWQHVSAEQRDLHVAMGFTKGWGEMLDKLTAHVLAQGASCPMSAPAVPEHGWLHRLLGEWSYEHECTGPDGKPMRAEGRESVRSLGGYWVVGEAEGSMPGGGPARWIMTMGFDATAGRFRGSWVGSMTGHMFIYDGALSEDGRTLTLESEGPAFDGNGMGRYRDVVEMVDDDTRLFRSLFLGPDREWTPFMTGISRRLAA